MMGFQNYRNQSDYKSPYLNSDVQNEYQSESKRVYSTNRNLSQDYNVRQSLDYNGRQSVDSRFQMENLMQQTRQQTPSIYNSYIPYQQQQISNSNFARSQVKYPEYQPFSNNEYYQDQQQYQYSSLQKSQYLSPKSKKQFAFQNQTVYPQQNNYVQNQQQQNQYQKNQSIQQQQFLQSQQLTKIMDCIIEQYDNIGGLYLGDVRAASDIQNLHQYNINAVLTIMQDYENQYPYPIQHLTIKALDMIDQNIIQHFEQALQFIHQQRQNGNNVLVHCYAGRSRSATLVIAYLILQQAFRHVKQRRYIVEPNQSFMRQLQEFERQLEQNQLQQNQLQQNQLQKYQFQQPLNQSYRRY